MKDSRIRKQENVRKHSKPGTIKDIPERKKHIVRVEE